MEYSILIILISFPVYFCIKTLIDYFIDTNYALKYYKYYFVSNTKNKNNYPYKILTESEYIKDKGYYDTNGKIRLVKRTDFVTIDGGYTGNRSNYGKYYVNGISLKETVNKLPKIEKQNLDTIIKKDYKKNKLTQSEFNNEVSKFVGIYENCNLEDLQFRLETIHESMSEVFEKSNIFSSQTGEFNFFIFLGEFREFAPLYAEYHALLEILISKNSNHIIVLDHKRFLKEISKIR